MAASRTLAAPLALAAALLAACTVEVDGAPCRVPGATEDCPAGQACGNDLRCSARAHACRDARCTPGVGGACLDPAGVATGTAVARRCTDADPVCGAWTDEPCAAGGYACGTRSGGALCECPPSAARALAVRPDGSPAGAPPYATGAASPPGCAFRRLTDALAAAAAVAAEPTAVATVTATGAAAGSTRTFSAASTGEVFPLAVMDRVRLASDEAAGGGAYEILFDADGAASAPVELHAGGALAGFTVRNGTGGASADAIALRCDGRSTPALLAGVVLEGRGAAGARLGRGLVADGTCDLVGREVQVRGFSAAGAVVLNGRLVLDRARVEDNAGYGVRGNDAAFSAAPRVEIRDSKIVRNGDTGVALVSATEVRITGTTVFANGAATSWGGPGAVPSGIARRAGGVVLWGNPPAAGSYEFGRNRIYSNRGDQVLALGTGSTWALDGPAGCGSDAAGPLYSHVGCYDRTSPAPTPTYRGIVAVDANVTATYWAWADGSTQATGATDWARLPSGSIGSFPQCFDGSLATPAACASEDPLPP
jgi:hypothetical protein